MHCLQILEILLFGLMGVERAVISAVVLAEELVLSFLLRFGSVVRCLGPLLYRRMGLSLPLSGPLFCLGCFFMGPDGPHYFYARALMALL